MKQFIGITLGDPAGIGPEIIVKSLAMQKVYDWCVPVVIGNAHSLEAACAACGIDLALQRVAHARDCVGQHGTIEYLSVGTLGALGSQGTLGALGSQGTLGALGSHTTRAAPVQPGIVSREAGAAAADYIIHGVQLAMQGAIDALVTAPISKDAINLAGHNFPGHTEMLAHYTNAEPGSFAMLLTTYPPPPLRGGMSQVTRGALSVIHATTHVSLRQACDLITTPRVLHTIRLADKAAGMLGIEQPVIGVAGLNPHASENGMFGSEETDSIIPAIVAARAEGIMAEGPLPPDTAFAHALDGKYAIVVAMYHDQGHIPLKLHGFRLGKNASVSGVNATIGLPIIRTSVDHGTAFDIAAKYIADPQSLLDAIEMAAVMANV